VGDDAARLKTTVEWHGSSGASDQGAFMQCAGNRTPVVWCAAVWLGLSGAVAFAQGTAPPTGGAGTPAAPFTTTYEQDTDRPGQDYYSFPTSLPVASLCQMACIADARCHAWAYNPPRQSSPTCWLKSKVPIPVKSPGLVAGVVRPDPTAPPPPLPPLIVKMTIESSAQNPVLCIDVPNAQFVQGANLQMWDCNNTVAQLFSFDLREQQLTIGNLCVQVAANAAQGAPVVLGACSAQTNVLWSVKMNGNWAQFVGLNGLCIGTGGAAKDGAPLQIATCANTPTQLWGFSRMSGI
jgi:Ricin-type beta-trefoil lectin domain/PAN domain